MKKYDPTIREHYLREAKNHALSATSTMKDMFIRDWETAATIEFLRWRMLTGHLAEGETIVDIGCGNGYTVARLAVEFPNLQFMAFDVLDEFVALASRRTQSFSNIKVAKGDIRTGYGIVDASVVLSQRVIINILDREDQGIALDQIVLMLRTGRRPGGSIFFESFNEALDNLNLARAEHGLEPAVAQYHNLYLDASFFEGAMLRRLFPPSPLLQRNYLSSHYFLGRVLYPLLVPDGGVARNSHLVNFLRLGLAGPIGDYSPLQVNCFESAAI